MATLKRLLASPRAPIAAALLAVLLALPALGGGPMMDDYAHRTAFHPAWQPPGGPRADWDMFRFQDGDAAYLRDNLDRGLWPWWTNPTFRLAFLRPLASLWHALDYRAYPDAYAWMHAESVILYGLCALAAGLVYRRALGASAAAGLCALLFAADDAHSMVVTYIANRHALLSALFGFLALAAHDRARRDGWAPGRILGPLGFALSMLAGESGISTLAYLFAHAVFLDRDALRGRALSLAPYAAVALGWYAAYRAGGYGASGGAFYIDPVREAGPFLAAAAARLPALLAAQLAVPPADLWAALAQPKQHLMLLTSLPILTIVGGALALVLRRDRTAAFWAIGMVLSLLPACATWPSDRLLLFSGLGGFGLIGSFLQASRAALSRPARLYAGAVAGLLWALHLALAPPLLPLRSHITARMLHSIIERGIESLPEEALRPASTVVVVNAPDTLVSNYSLAARFARMERPSFPRGLRLLGVALAGTMEISRPDARTLSMTLSEGLLHDWTSRVFRTPATPFRVGDRVEIPGMVVEVKELMEDGARPRRFDFTFDRPLEDPSLVWLIWVETRFERFEPPAIGEARTLPAIDASKAMGL